MPVRRPHRKSRNGCAECKRRRVKCNEQLPCQNCLKYQSDCVYQTELGPRQQSPASHADRNASTSVVGAMQSLAGTSLCNLARTAEFEARDLELMHHFTTSVAKTLSYRDEIQGAWAIALPKEAYSCDYLMHGLLALSALHLDSSSRGKGHNYADLSTYHVHSSLARFRERLVNISIENCVPLFGNSSLMVIYVCAQAAMEKHSKTARENSQSHIGMLMDIFNMCRGVETVLAPYREEIRQSSLSPLLHEDYCLIPDLSSRRDTDPPEEPRLSYLVNLIRSQSLEPQDQDEYLDALTKLETAFRFMHVAAKPLEPGAAFVWPITLQRGSIRLFTQLSHPHLSLVLIAHYCIILHHLDGYWFLHGWHKALLNEITDTLPPELKTWIRWPRNVCGLVDSGNWNNGQYVQDTD